MSVVENDKPVVAAFDFDGTLTRRDTLQYFLLYTLGTMSFIRNTIVLFPTLLGYALGWIRNDIAKQRVFAQCLAGIKLEELQILGEKFAAEVLPGLLRKKAFDRFEWHRKQGHRCIVISASLDLYVRPWAMQIGFDEVIASHLETLEDGNITGNLLGGNCFGPEKIRRLEALIGDRSEYTLYAYGDSQGDRELLGVADFAFYRKFPELDVLMRSE